MMKNPVFLRDGILWIAAAVLLLAAASPPLLAQNYTPLEGLRVSDGRVQFLFSSAGQCINLSNSRINGVAYTTHTSKWQRRAGSSWVDISGTEREGLCSYSPTSPGEYRLVAEISIDGERGHYSSENTLTVEGEEIPELEPVATLYFPDYVDGGGWSVQLAVSNIDTTAAAAVVVTAYDQEGQPIPGFFDSEATFEIPPLGNRILRSTGVGEEGRRGWIEVRTDTESVRGLLTYRHSETGIEVGVESVELGDHFALFVEESSGIGTGLAIFKPDPSSTIEFRIYGEDGINPLDEEFARVGDFNQVARTIPEWFAMDGVDTEFLEDFRGLLFLRAEDGSLFASIGIRFGKRGESLSSVPVIQVTAVPESPAQLAPADEAAFNDLFVGKRAATNLPTVYADFISPGRFRETRFLDIWAGSYTYRNTGPNTGTVTFNYDDGDRCTASLMFDSTTSGTATSMCDDGPSLDYNWRLVEIP